MLRNIVFHDFDNTPLAARPCSVVDDARPLRAGIVIEHKEHAAVDTIVWPSMSPYMNPIEHVWDANDKNLNRRDPLLQNFGD